MIGIKLGLALGGNATGASAFSLALTGLTDGVAVIGDHATIGYTIDPDNGTETVKWSNSADSGDAATYGTGANPTDFTAGDEGTLYLHVTDDGETVTRSALIRYAAGTAPAVADGQSWTVDDTSVNLDGSASGANLTFSYVLTGQANGVSINSGTGAITGTPDTVESGTATITATDQYGRTLQDTFTWSAALRTQATGGADLDLSFPEDSAISSTDLTANWTENGNTVTYAITGTALPAGLSVSTAGVMTGTPTTVTADATYTLRGTDEYGRTTDDTFTLEIAAISITATTAPVLEAMYNTQVLNTLAQHATIISTGNYSSNVGTISTVEYLIDGVAADPTDPVATGEAITIRVTDSAANTQTWEIDASVEAMYTATTPTATTIQITSVSSLPDGAVVAVPAIDLGDGATGWTIGQLRAVAAGTPLADGVPTVTYSGLEADLDVDDVLTGVDPGFAYTGTVPTITRHWESDNVDISGATGQTFTITADEQDTDVTFLFKPGSGAEVESAAVSVPEAAPTGAMESDTEAEYWYRPEDATLSGTTLVTAPDNTGNGNTLSQIGSLDTPEVTGGAFVFSAGEIMGTSALTTNGLGKALVDGGSICLFIVQDVEIGVGLDDYYCLLHEGEDASSSTDNEQWSFTQQVFETVAETRFRIRMKDAAGNYPINHFTSQRETGLGKIIVEVVIDQAQSHFLYNNTDLQSKSHTDTNFVDTTGLGLRIGGLCDGSTIYDAYDGKIYEIFATKDAGTTNRNAVRSQLATKHGITL